jgi:hypothetical protein
MEGSFGGVSTSSGAVLQLEAEARGTAGVASKRRRKT